MFGTQCLVLLRKLGLKALVSVGVILVHSLQGQSLSGFIALSYNLPNYKIIFNATQKYYSSIQCTTFDFFFVSSSRFFIYCFTATNASFLEVSFLAVFLLFKFAWIYSLVSTISSLTTSSTLTSSALTTSLDINFYFFFFFLFQFFFLVNILIHLI